MPTSHCNVMGPGKEIRPGHLQEGSGKASKPILTTRLRIGGLFRQRTDPSKAKDMRGSLVRPWSSGAGASCLEEGVQRGQSDRGIPGSQWKELGSCSAVQRH